MHGLDHLISLIKLFKCILKQDRLDLQLKIESTFVILHIIMTYDFVGVLRLPISVMKVVEFHSEVCQIQ